MHPHAFVIALVYACSLFLPLKGDLAAEYDHSAFLDPDEIYKLYWSVKSAEKTIIMAVEVKTLGWVGFGISQGLTGSMKGADIVVGWVDDKGKGQLTDYHAAANTRPSVDAKQDYELTAASENGGKTVLKFKRKLVTCDKDDRDIPLGTAKVIYAYGTTDTFAYHTTKRGARSVNLLNYVQNVPPPANAKQFDVTIKKVPVPKVKTTYWCQVYKMTDLVTLNTTQHIIEIEPIVAKKDQGVVHHMVLYACKDDFDTAHLNVTGPCYHPNMPRSVKECVGAAAVFAWAIGGVNYKFPSHVGWPIGAPYSMKYMILETHFDNPTMNSNFVVTTGLKFYYDAPRKYEAETLTTGMGVGDSHIIPPRQENWISTGFCPKECTEKIKGPGALNGNEIKIFASFPHAHTAGNGIWTTLVRDGKEVQEVFRDDNYDFDYQQTYVLRKEVPFRAGDEMKTYCRYNTMKRKDATVGGLATTDEMCLNFIMYYPRMSFTKCVSVDLAIKPYFSKRYAKPMYRGLKTNSSFTPGSNQYNWTDVSWNQTMIKELKDAYAYNKGNITYPVCLGSSGVHYPMNESPRTVITKKLQPPADVCVKVPASAVKHAPGAAVLIWSAFYIALLCFIN